MQVIEQRLLQVAFGVSGPLGGAGEFEDVRVADEVFDGFPGFLAVGAPDDGGLVRREAGAFVEERADVALKLADGPVALEALVLVEGAFERVVEADGFNELGPG